MPVDAAGIVGDWEWACPECDGDGRALESDEPCPTCGGSGKYPGVANAWGQYGVSSVYIDTDGEDKSEQPRKLVCMDTFMCETALTPAGAHEVARRLNDRAHEIEREERERRLTAKLDAGEHPLSDLRDELGTRTFNALSRAGVQTVEDLARTGDEELLRLSGFGPLALERAREASERA